MTLAERIQQHYAAEIAEIDRQASDTAVAIMHKVSITLMSSADLQLTLDGHHIKADLSRDAHDRLQTMITEIVRSKLSIQRCEGERTALIGRAEYRSHLTQ